jgi:hypothetical protein
MVLNAMEILEGGNSGNACLVEILERELSVSHPWGGCMSQELLQSLSKFTVMCDGRAALESEHNLLGS